MVRCPVCQNQEIEGALFCTMCGTALTMQEYSPEVANSYGSRVGTPPQPLQEAFPEPKEPPARVALRVLANDQVIPLDGIREFTLGRVSGNQPILPDIDLTSYKAYEGGVSRLHATINVKPDAVTISDLGSANGTRINGKRLAAHTSQELADGDVLTLGKFKLQVIIRDINK